MKKQLYYTLLALVPLNFTICTALFGQDQNGYGYGMEQTSPYVDQTPETPVQGQEFPLKGILLAGSPLVQNVEEVALGGVTTYDLCLPGDAGCFLKYIDDNFLGKPLTYETVLSIKEAVIKYYRDNHRPFVIVEIPEQNITCGILQVLVKEAVIGDISVFGNCWYNNEFFLRQVRLHPGQRIVTDTLLTDVAWMNRNPFHRTDIVYTAGAREGETNVELVTTDRFPLYLYAGYDNTGNAVTGRNRFFTGFTLGNPFGVDDLLSYQYTTSNDFSQFSSHFGDYVRPLPWRHVLMLYGGYAKIRRHHNVDFRSDGNSGQASIRYEVPFEDVVNNVYNEFRFGFDYKNTNNNLLFVGENEIPVIANDVNISQFMFQWNYEQDILDNPFLASIEVYGSPGQMLPHETDKDYSHLRLGAKANYIYERFTMGYQYDLGPCHEWFDWVGSFALLGRGQWTNQNLLPSEQFVIGGYDTVRGYQEYEVAVDRGAIINFELRSRPVSFLHDIWCCIPEDEFMFILFMDYGAGSQSKIFRCGKPHLSDQEQRELDQLQHEFGEFGGERIHSFFEPSRFNLWSVGPGLRYRINRYFSARLDWGIRLERTPFEHYGSRVHFGIMGSF